MAPNNRWTGSRLLPYMDGGVYHLTTDIVDFKSASTIQTAFYQACRVRGWGSKTSVKDGVATVQRVPRSEAIVKSKSTYLKPKGVDVTHTNGSVLTFASELYKLTGEYLRTPVGSQEARDVLGRMLAASRGK